MTLGILDGAASTGRGAVYKIAPALRQQRTWLEDRVPKLISYFGSHERLTNQEYCRIFDVTRNIATRDLKRLSDEGFLIAAGTKNGAHYVTGPALNRFLAT